VSNSQYLFQFQALLRFVKAAKSLGVRDLGAFLELVVSPATKVLGQWFGMLFFLLFAFNFEMSFFLFSLFFFCVSPRMNLNP
jgi:hypothetical protein